HETRIHVIGADSCLVVLSTLHSYDPHFPTSRLRGRQKSLSKNMHLRKYSLQSKDNLFYCRISQKRRAEFTLLPYALEH
ncbi:hypothetical protein J5991_01805, partial [Methanocorpusculum sp.]|nr:hypothetical protein [Methanocorpusculum sp.]